MKHMKMNMNQELRNNEGISTDFASLSDSFILLLGIDLETPRSQPVVAVRCHGRQLLEAPGPGGVFF